MIRFILLIFMLFSTQVFAASVEEIQELNLAKAELALVDGNIKEAAKMIQKNLIRKNFHLASYQFLIDLYLRQGLHSKAFRVYYFLIKRLHTDRILTAGDRRALLFAYKKSPKPTEEVLRIYEDIAKTYFNMNDDKKLKDKKRPLFLLNMAKKYFGVMLHYKFNVAEARYYMGLIEKRQKNYGEAITNFLEAKDMFLEETGDQSLANELDFLVGETLIQTGFTDAGSIFLQSVYLQGRRGGSLRDYAQQYIDSLYSQDLYFYSLSLGMTNNNNVHSLSDSDIETFDTDLKEIYGSVDGTSTDLTLSAFYNSKQEKHFQYIASAYYIQNEYGEENISFQDIKSYGASGEIRYDNLIKSLVRLNYSLAKTKYRPEASAAYEDLSTAHTITLSYGHLLKSGLITYRIPYLLTSSEIGEDTSSFGLEINFVPYTNTQYFRPSYTIEFNSNDEGDEDIERTREISPSFTNHFKLGDNRSIFLTGTYTWYNNDDESTGYKEYQLDASYSYIFKFWNKLSGALNYSYSNQSQDDGDVIKTTTFSGNLTVSF